MKATIEFDLPKEQDAYWDAINGARWREFVRHLQIHVSKLRDIDENPACRDGYFQLKKWIREEMGEAGLTQHSTKSLKTAYNRHEKFCSEQVSKYYKDQEAADLRPQMGTPHGTTETVVGSPKRKLRKRRTGDGAGAEHDNPPPA